ncbi:putative nuclease HARBI1 [Portunus trituberculatus]|uniref:putative nuclease HARBI1 n=1 Tax=Portunus trituberculatus TaxID=210409 RepID=UPI001E1CEA4D|nr:putative nuclease HARBI1 [Portunus trituberculatus]
MDAQQERARRPRQHRVRKDVLNMYDDAKLIKRYRLDREGILLVTDMVRDKISPATNRSNSVGGEMKVLTTLRYLATGKMQLCNGDDLGLSQQTISKVIGETLDALVTDTFISRFVKFPTRQAEIPEKQAEFMGISGFPGVVGVIDGTHVRLISPKEYEAEYVNRKNYHSNNTQVVFDAKYRILDVVAKWPGATHDARIFSESGLKIRFERGIVPAGCYLLGDSG